jgi:hypothetical protein
MKKGTLWNSFLEYIRNKKVGEDFSRQELLKKFKRLDKKRQVTTIDNYRMLLLSCGYLAYVTAGTYKKIKPIPLMTKKLATDRAYKQTWRSWFLEEEDAK